MTQQGQGKMLIWPYIASWTSVYSSIIGFLGLLLVEASPLVGYQKTYEGAVATMNTIAIAYLNIILGVGLPLFSVLIYSAWRNRNNPEAQALRLVGSIKLRRVRPVMLASLFSLVFSLIALQALQAHYLAVLSMITYVVLITFTASFTVFGMGMALFILNPGPFSHFSFRVPVSLQSLTQAFEVHSILAAFRRYPKIKGRASSTLLSESYSIVSDRLDLELPVLEFDGLSQTYVDIQLALRWGSQGELDAVENYFARLGEIFGTWLSGQAFDLNAMMDEIRTVRTGLTAIDLFRDQQKISGTWEGGITPWIQRHEKILTVAVALGGLLIGIISLVLRPV